jgi:hypothetical protein
VVLFTLILATGLGSLASERIGLTTGRRLVVWSALLGAYLAALTTSLPAILSAFEGAGTVTRASVAVGCILPAGLLMGFGFPTGMRFVESVDRRPTPWLWGVNGAAGVLASVIAVIISIGFGISVTLLVGTACYLVMGPALLIAGLRWRDVGPVSRLN